MLWAYKMSQSEVCGAPGGVENSVTDRETREFFEREKLKCLLGHYENSTA
jgi:hypothetical protein